MDHLICLSSNGWPYFLQVLLDRTQACLGISTQLVLSPASWSVWVWKGGGGGEGGGGDLTVSLRVPPCAPQRAHHAEKCQLLYNLPSAVLWGFAAGEMYPHPAQRLPVTTAHKLVLFGSCTDTIVHHTPEIGVLNQFDSSFKWHHCSLTLARDSFCAAKSPSSCDIAAR